MDRHLLSERDICTKFITPAIGQAGWAQHQFREEVTTKAKRSSATSLTTTSPSL
ncbi:hypothetical protein [Rhodoferax sp. UBA5149]|uniref:hypothetical protein n=1 Tax=Rhodoferax sp. UBA5149 TaxID=1947379 RepID=UPI0025F56766|nr:hypothetical protein [Rhodoferax sp. UBA5149]